MKVKEIIEQLQKMDAEKEVVIVWGNRIQLSTIEKIAPIGEQIGIFESK